MAALHHKRRSSASVVGHPFTAAALELPLEARRELTLSLLWSLPRDDVIALNDNISRMLQKDIIGQLPPELAILILAKLDLTDILKCRLISKTWDKLCDDQSLWATLCKTHAPAIRPRQTTWADLSLHQQLLHSSESRTTVESDEGGYESNFEDFGFSPDMSHDPIAGQGGLGGGGGIDPFVMTSGVRGAVWERSASGLPTHIQPSSSRKIFKARKSSKSRTSEGNNNNSTPSFSPVSSHLAIPTSTPQTNYKHLYIVIRILVDRMKASQNTLRNDPLSDTRSIRFPKVVRPKVIDTVSSIEAGGLPGHSESIYALQLISRQMSISVPNPQRESPIPLPVGFDKFVSPSSPEPKSTVISGRDWLLSSSRDHTLRLWQIACLKPKVVKIFHGGHTGSVLCLAITEVPIVIAPTGEGTSTFFTSPSKSVDWKKRTRMMAVSGGKDGKICLWDIEHGDGTPEKTIQAHEETVLSIKADDERIVSSARDRTIRVFDVHTLQQLLVIDCRIQEGLHRMTINSVCLTKDYILSASGDRTIRVWDIVTGQSLAFIEAATRGISSMDFSPPAINSHPALKGTIITGSSDASIKVFHLVSHTRTGVDIVDALDMIPPMRDLTFREMLFDHEDEVEAASTISLPLANDITMNDDPDRLDAEEITLNGEGMEGIPELRIELAGQCWASCVCPSGLSKPDSTLCARCYNKGHTDLVRSVFLSEQVIISGSYDSTVKIWDRTSGRLLTNLSGVHTGRVFCVAGDKMRIVSSGIDSRISIWDFSEGLDTAFVEP